MTCVFVEVTIRLQNYDRKRPIPRCGMHVGQLPTIEQSLPRSYRMDVGLSGLMGSLTQTKHCLRDPGLNVIRNVPAR